MAHKAMALATKPSEGTRWGDGTVLPVLSQFLEEPVVCRYASAFPFHPTLAGMLGATLLRNEVVYVGQPLQICLLTATGMMEALHPKGAYFGEIALIDPVNLDDVHPSPWSCILCPR